MDNIPPQYGIPLAIILWLILFVMLLRDRVRIRRAEKQLSALAQGMKIYNPDTERWELVRAPQEIFDQDEYAQQPARHRVEPKVRAANDLPNPPKGSSA